MTAPHDFRRIGHSTATTLVRPKVEAFSLSTVLAFHDRR